MSETKTIVLTVVRHGQTDANKERIVQGEKILYNELMGSNYQMSNFKSRTLFSKYLLEYIFQLAN